MTVYEAAMKLTAGELAGWAVVLLIILFSLIQIAPVKLNPWDSILGWLGRKINGATVKRLESVEKQIRGMWINDHRQRILTFARECRDKITHSPDEWVNVLNVAEEYEKYVKEEKITNGIVTQDTEYIRSLYQEMSREHRI